MPPVQQVWDFPGIPGDVFFVHKPSHSPSVSPSLSASPDTYLAKRDIDTSTGNGKSITARSDKTYVPGKGTVDPHHINMQGLLALFAILGAAFVIAGIWFFFWAKNGGFQWRKGDWEEYKSTVLRRKGPDGKTLSNATKSTKLGGGSVVGKGYSDWEGEGDGYTESGLGYADTATNLTKKTGRDRRQRLKDIAKRRFMRKRAEEQSWNGEEYEDEDVRAYRKEKAATVGGVNRDAEGTYHGSDYDTSAPPTQYNQSEMSEVRDYAFAPPVAARHKSQRQSRNFSFTPGTESQVTGDQSYHPRDSGNRRIREPSARRHNRRRERRRNPPPPTSSSSSSRQDSHHPRKQRRSNGGGHYTESSLGSRSEFNSNLYSEDESGTRSYHHPIPGLTKGYRRDGGRGRRRDSLSESDGEETRYS